MTNLISIEPKDFFKTKKNCSADMIANSFRLYKNLESNMLKLAAMQVIPYKTLLLPMANLTRLQKNQNCSSAAVCQINQSTAHTLQMPF